MPTQVGLGLEFFCASPDGVTPSVSSFLGHIVVTWGPMA